MSELRVERSGPALRLTIDRPQRRNALDPDLVGALRAALADLGDARVVVLTGAGDAAFCAGADIGRVTFDPDVTALEQHEQRSGLRELFVELRECPLPVVARVQGVALAGGLGLMLACDVVVAADSAKFGMPEVDVGLWPFMIGALVTRHVSAKRALDLMMTGRWVDAATAHEWGLVSRVVPAAALDDAVDELVGELSGKSPLVLRVGKRSFYATEDLALEPALARLQAELSLLSQSKDAAEGVAAFFQKRPPRWTGR
jgi:enoyl-CoA hydratase